MSSCFPKTFHIIAGAIAAFLLLAVWVMWGNSALMISTISISSSKVPGAFSGFKIAQISDFHNANFGHGNKKLLNMLLKSKPNIIVVTGDLFDARNTDIDIALNFLAGAKQIAPVYYVLGNHEAYLLQRGKLKIGPKLAGAVVLKNKSIQLVRGGEKISLIGLSDPNFITSEEIQAGKGIPSIIGEKLKTLIASKSSYNILLSHRPELFEIYANCGVDLVFSGHAHGGQFRLPFVGGLYAPSQGWFPKYDSGLYINGKANMVVSRGIGKSVVPFRFNNRPEIILVELHKKNN